MQLPSFTLFLTHPLREVTNVINDWIDESLYFEIPKELRHLAEDIKPFGRQVAEKFPQAGYDIEEAAKCLAFERWTAALYHLGRVAEIVTVTFAKKAGYEDWGESLNKALNYIETNLKKLRENRQSAHPEFIGRKQFFSDIAVLMRNDSDAWRNPVSHMGTKYTSEEARRIFNTTKELVAHLASKMPEFESSC